MSTPHRRRVVVLLMTVAAGISGCDVSEPFRVLTDDRVVDRVVVTPANVEASIADTVQLTAEALGASDRAIPEATIVWSTGDPSIARSIGDGRFVVLSRGLAQVFATARGTRGIAQINVTR